MEMERSGTVNKYSPAVFGKKPCFMIFRIFVSLAARGTTGSCGQTRYGKELITFPPFYSKKNIKPLVHPGGSRGLLLLHGLPDAVTGLFAPPLPPQRLPVGGGRIRTGGGGGGRGHRGGGRTHGHRGGYMTGKKGESVY